MADGSASGFSAEQRLRASNLAYERIDDWDCAVAAAVALREIEVYADAADRQARRVREAFDRSLGNEGAAGYFLVSAVLTEAAFLFACWHRLQKMLDVLVDTAGLPEVRRVRDRHAADIRRFAEVRHDFVHIEDRLPGRKNAEKVTSGPQGWAFAQITSPPLSIRIGRATYDVSAANAEQFLAIVADVRAAAIRELTSYPPADVHPDRAVR